MPEPSPAMANHHTQQQMPTARGGVDQRYVQRPKMPRQPSDTDDTFMDSDDIDLEVERLEGDINQEQQMRSILDASVDELRMTILELEKRCNGIEDEGCEWKTRFETQLELNNLLEKHCFFLQDKIGEAKMTTREGQLGQLKALDELSEQSLKKMMKQLEREKSNVESQLKDYEWRMEQENKAYHKANEERHQHLVELNKLKQLLTNRSRLEQNRPQPPFNSRGGGNGAQRDAGIPPNQRIIDPRKGPIKKTAAVRKLPKIRKP